MPRRIVAPFAAVGLALAVASCATLEREDVAAPAQGGPVAMRVNTALVVSLAPDPVTGSRWELKSASPNLVLIGGPDVTPAPRPPGLVGVADTIAFRFRARGAGAGALEFVAVALPGQAPLAVPQVVRYDVAVGPSLWLMTDYFGTVGLDRSRNGGSATGTFQPDLQGAPGSAAGPAGATPQGSVK